MGTTKNHFKKMLLSIKYYSYICLINCKMYRLYMCNRVFLPFCFGMVGLDVFDLDEALEDKNNVVKKKKINI